jgi:hypothetical protein
VDINVINVIRFQKFLVDTPSGMIAARAVD